MNKIFRESIKKTKIEKKKIFKDSFRKRAFKKKFHHCYSQKIYNRIGL